MQKSYQHEAIFMCVYSNIYISINETPISHND